MLTQVVCGTSRCKRSQVASSTDAFAERIFPKPTPERADPSGGPSGRGQRRVGLHVAAGHRCGERVGAGLASRQEHVGDLGSAGWPGADVMPSAQLCLRCDAPSADLRFLLACAPGTGKTSVEGMHPREIRLGFIHRALLVAPAHPRRGPAHGQDPLRRNCNPNCRPAVLTRSQGSSVRLWVPETLSPHATCEYPWIRPPSRSRRRTRMFAPGAADADAQPAGADAVSHAADARCSDRRTVN